MPSTPELPATVIEAAVQTQRAARSTALWLAHGIDSWFGSEPFPDVDRVRDGRLEVSLFKRRDQNVDLDVRFDARFRLPNLQRTAYVFIGRDDSREAIRDTPTSASLPQRLLSENREDSSFLAGLGLGLPRGFDLRVGLGPRLKPYTQLRWRKRWEPSADQNWELRQTFFWRREDRGGSTTALAYERELSPLWRLRWISAGTITEVSRNVEWSTSLGASRFIRGERVATAEAVFGGNGNRGRGTGYSDAGLLLKYEQPVFEDWLRGELIVGHFWPRPDRQSERGRAWALGASVKMRF